MKIKGLKQIKLIQTTSEIFTDVYAERLLVLTKEEVETKSLDSSLKLIYKYIFTEDFVTPVYFVSKTGKQKELVREETQEKYFKKSSGIILAKEEKILVFETEEIAVTYITQEGSDYSPYLLYIPTESQQEEKEKQIEMYEEELKRT